MDEQDCIFCKIAKKEIPATKVYEDRSSFAFLDVKPHAKGHSVVIPKEHAVTVFDLTEEQYKNLMVSVRETMNRIQQVLNPDGFNVGWNHKTAGGQVVPHLHVHIMPRYNGDGGGSMHSIISNPSDDVTDLFQ
jgi:histidine triad (HIT) family protein